MNCPKCGFKNKENAKFCSKCGSKLEEAVEKQKSEDNSSKIIIGITIVIVVAIILFTCFSIGLFGVETYDESSSVSQDGGVSDSGVSQISLSSFPVSEAPFLAQQIAQSGYSDSINYKGVTLSKSQILYIFTKSIVMLNQGNVNGSIDVGNYSYADHPAGRDGSQSITASQYVDMCNRFSSWMERNHQVPNYIGINKGGASDVSPSKMMKLCSDILVQYKNTGSLPSSINL